MNEIKTSASKIAVLVPCFNEAATIAKVVADFRRAIPEAAIHVFDNNSTDNTAQIARGAGAIVHHEKKQGKGYVVAAMFEKIDADFYLMVDGDDTYPAERARELLEPVIAGQADMTVGQREAVDEAAAYRRFHVAGNWLVRTMVNLIFGANLKDIMSGYRGFTREVARNIPIMAYGFDIETEMTVQCLYRKWVICEIPVAYRERPEGSVSKLNTFRDGFRVIFRIFNLFRSYKPLTFFGGLGILMFIASISCGLSVMLGHWPTDSNWRVGLITGGFVLLAMSLVTAAIGVIVQLVNFRFLELDSVLRRDR
jgi:glycosyltransferase involved in cell wall biosynthesis